MPLLSLLLSCLEGSYYASHETWQTFPVADSGGGGGTGPTLPCNRPDEGTVADLTVQNPTFATYHLSRMNAACEEEYQTTIGQGASWAIVVGNHVVWVVREEDGTYVRSFSVPSGSDVAWVEVLP